MFSPEPLFLMESQAPISTFIHKKVLKFLTQVVNRNKISVESRAGDGRVEGGSKLSLMIAV